MVDTPDAFIQTRVQHNKDTYIIKIRGVLVDILLEPPKDIYNTYVTTYHKGVKKNIFTVTEWHIWNNDDKYDVIPEVQEEPWIRGIWIKYLRPMRYQQDHQE